ncbi:hypothetical protein HMPREF9602_01004 [Cutibacterium acnes HL030PA2]|nr:hypothetical protein HMPREF9602_01004 [Cutibacterium acnes HL030PA2]
MMLTCFSIGSRSMDFNHSRVSGDNAVSRTSMPECSTNHATTRS